MESLTVATTGLQAFFLEGMAGPLFCIHHSPLTAARTRRGVLVLPPFAEEMNKSRRMLTLAAQGLRGAGTDVLMVDLLGTGDSAGEFADATLEAWRSDVERAAGWLSERDVSHLDILAVRGGALLLEDLKLPTGLARGRLVLWQPQINGKLLVSQFLRLRLAQGLGRVDRVTEAPDSRTRLANAGRIEVAGYEITTQLVRELEAVTEPLRDANSWERVFWLEVVADDVTDVSPASLRAVDAMRSGGATVDVRVVPGEPFWATPEIAVVPGLVTATIAALTGKSGA